MIAGITVDFRAGIACPAINRPVADDGVVFFSADQLVRMGDIEFQYMAARRRQTPRELLCAVMRAAAAAAQRVLDQDQGGEEVREEVLQLLLQGEVVPGRGGALHFELFV
ncbi:MAG: hypothetical protein IT368_01820 [Candidatus Hydrogenedentes bacterium]|nr:hypothetical protein [Candidatus Hydrogenedentota bacterium]